MLKWLIIISGLQLFGIGLFTMFISDLSIIPFIPQDAPADLYSEFRAMFAGSFVAFGYLLIRYALSASFIPIGLMIIYVMISISFGRVISFLYEGISPFSLFAFFGELSLAIILYLYYRKKKNEISYF